MSNNLEDTLDERGNRYGEYMSVAITSQRIKEVLRAGDTYRRASLAHKESLDMIANKLARIVNGDAGYRDNWHDIQGYSKLAEDRCPPVD